MLSDAMNEHDQELLQDWKDDLGNLLVFVSICLTCGIRLLAYV